MNDQPKLMITKHLAWVHAWFNWFSFCIWKYSIYIVCGSIAEWFTHLFYIRKVACIVQLETQNPLCVYFYCIVKVCWTSLYLNPNLLITCASTLWSYSSILSLYLLFIASFWIVEKQCKWFSTSTTTTVCQSLTNIVCPIVLYII